MSYLSRRDVMMQGSAAAMAISLLGCRQNISETSNASNSTVPEPAVRDLILPRVQDASGTRRGWSLNTEHQYVDQLGVGFDSVFDDRARPLVTGTIRRSVVNPTDHDVRNGLQYELIENQHDYYSLVQKSSRAKGRYKMFEGGAAGSIERENATNSYSLHICALVKRYDASYQLDSSTIRIADGAREIVDRYRSDKPALLKFMGDSFVSGIIPGAELFVDIKFETSSTTAKSECKASVEAKVGALASGSAAYSQLLQEARSYKSVKIEIIGLDGTAVPRQYTADEVHALITNFLGATDSQSRVAFENVKSIRELSLEGNPLDWVDFEELRIRELFVAEAANLLDDLGLAHADAAYVTTNPTEFDEQTRVRARADLARIASAHTNIIDAGARAHANFRNTGITGPLFDRGLLRNLVPQLETYIQLEPPPPPAAPPPPPQQPQARERDREGCRNFRLC